MGTLFRLFSVFFKQTSLQILQQIYVKKCSSSIWCRDMNPRPLEREYLAITMPDETVLQFKLRGSLPYERHGIKPNETLYHALYKTSCRII